MQLAMRVAMVQYNTSTGCQPFAMVLSSSSSLPWLRIVCVPSMAERLAERVAEPDLEEGLDSVIIKMELVALVVVCCIAGTVSC